MYGGEGQCIIDEMNFPFQNNPVISWTLGPLLSMSGSQPRLVLWVVPIVTFDPLRNDGNGRMGTRQSLTWGERNYSVTSHTHEEHSEWKGGEKNKKIKTKTKTNPTLKAHRPAKFSTKGTRSLVVHKTVPEVTSMPKWLPEVEDFHQKSTNGIQLKCVPLRTVSHQEKAQIWHALSPHFSYNTS